MLPKLRVFNFLDVSQFELFDCRFCVNLCMTLLTEFYLYLCDKWKMSEGK